MKIEKDKLAIGVLIPLAVGGISSLLTKDSMEAFAKLNQPPLSPPKWLFPVAWSILYALMGIASYLIYRQGTEKPEVKNALRLYGLQLLFNFLWPVFFFRFDWFLFSFFWLLALWLQVISLISQAGKIDKTARNLLIPYLIWLTFAAYLNLGVYLLNR